MRGVRCRVVRGKEGLVSDELGGACAPRRVCGGPGRVALGAAVSPEKTFFFFHTDPDGRSRRVSPHTKPPNNTYSVRRALLAPARSGRGGNAAMRVQYTTVLPKKREE